MKPEQPPNLNNRDIGIENNKGQKISTEPSLNEPKKPESGDDRHSDMFIKVPLTEEEKILSPNELAQKYNVS